MSEKDFKGKVVDINWTMPDGSVKGSVPKVEFPMPPPTPSPKASEPPVTPPTSEKK